MAGPSKIQEEKKQALRLYNILYNPIKKKKCSVKCRSININIIFMMISRHLFF